MIGHPSPGDRCSGPRSFRFTRQDELFLRMIHVAPPDDWRVPVDSADPWTDEDDRFVQRRCKCWLRGEPWHTLADLIGIALVFLIMMASIGLFLRK